MSDSDHNQPNQIVVVIHGIGDPDPGTTLGVLSRSMADPEHPYVESPCTTWLFEKSNLTGQADDVSDVKTFPVHQTNVHFENKHIELCEAFWGDLSRVNRGWFGVLQGIFQIVFGLRYVAYVAGDQSGKAALWLKRLGLVSSRILQGPVLAVTVFLGLMIAAVCGSHIVWKASHSNTHWPHVLILACGGFAFLAAAIGSRVTRSRVVERFWFWMNVTTGFVVCVMFVRVFWLDSQFPEIAHSCEVHPGVLWYCHMLVVLLGFLWFVEIQVITAMACCCLLASFKRNNHRPALIIAFLLPALAVGIWSQVIPMSWLAIKESTNALYGLSNLSQVFDDAIPYLGVQMLMAVVILLTLIVTLIRYALWRSRDPVTDYQNNITAPRLVIHPWMQSMLLLCTGVGVVLVSSLWLMNTFATEQGHGEHGLSGLNRSLATINGYAISVLVPLGGLFIFFLAHLRPGFDMILDIVNHFYFRPTNVNDVLDDDDEFDIAETTFENGTLFFSRREALHDRLRRLLVYYRDKYDHQPELVLISHSQGTMAAIETLNDRDLDWLNNSFRTVTLVTMGSPFSHLYQHYFAHLYPPLIDSFWNNLNQRVDRWVNVFRVDDYVGNEINFPPPMKSEPQPYTTGTRAFVRQTEYQNIAVGPRGHVNYWADREVLEHLRRELSWNVDDEEVRRAA